MQAINFSEAILSLLRCRACGERLAVLPYGPDAWLVWRHGEVFAGCNPREVAARAPVCVSCGGDLLADITLAALSSSGEWVDVGRNDPLYEENVLRN